MVLALFERRALPPAEFGKLFSEDMDKWGKVVRAADMKLETSR
jgi:hypothetical protein